MRSKFSETQFSFGIMREIVDGLVFGYVGVPIFPSLIQEGEHGWDVRFDSSMTAYFLQFKVAEKLTSKNAKEMSAFSGNPYFRFKTYPDYQSKQHELLFSLSKNDRNNVFYCAPAFISIKEFEANFLNKKIAQESFFVNLKDFSDVNNTEQHSICFQLNPISKFMIFSNPKEIKGFVGWNNLRQSVSEQNKRYQSISEFTIETYVLLREHVDIMKYVEYFQEQYSKTLMNKYESSEFWTLIKFMAIVQSLAMLGIFTCFE